MTDNRQICECGHPYEDHETLNYAGKDFCRWADCDCHAFKEGADHD